jgi:hypothetical protein
LVKSRHDPQFGASGQREHRSSHLFRVSTGNQSDAIAHHAPQRGIEIVRTCSDEGKSGLRIQGRDGLKHCIDDIRSGRSDYEAVPVHDISRWGRFQDADESASDEYICKRAGIAVICCAEQFENDGSPVSTIVKGVKRRAGRVRSTSVLLRSCNKCSGGHTRFLPRPKAKRVAECAVAKHVRRGHGTQHPDLGRCGCGQSCSRILKSELSLGKSAVGFVVKIFRGVARFSIATQAR